MYLGLLKVLQIASAESSNHPFSNLSTEIVLVHRDEHIPPLHALQVLYWYRGVTVLLPG